jgi:thiosulfate reductase/polysulfide reductase chain A
MAAKAKLPKYKSPEFPKPKWGWRDIAPDKYPFASDVVTNLLVDGSHPDYTGEHKIKSWFVMGTNLPVSMPDTKRTLEAIQNQEFIVVIDTMPSEITGYADIVLPECTYLERYDDIRVLPHREPNLALRAPAMEPRFESKPGWWIAKEIAKRLGLGEYFDFNDYADVLDWQLKQVGSSLEEMKKIGVKKFEREFDDLYFADGEIPEFDTPSGKIELYSEDLASYGFPPMPVYKPMPEPEAGFYRLIYGRAPMHTFSRTTNNPRLTDLMAENKIWVNPKVAKEWDLKNDQEIWLQNQDGIISEFPIKVRITERIRWDSVYMVHGFGRKDKRLSRGYGKGISDTEMITKVLIDPESGGTGMRSNFVTFVTENPGKEVVS